MNPPPLTPAEQQRIHDDALDWLVRRAGGGLSARDEAAFQAWQRVSARHRAAYAERESDWAALDRLPADRLETLRANLADELMNESAATHSGRPVVANPRPAPASTGARRRRLFLPAFAAAAAVMLLVGVGLIAWRDRLAEPVFAQRFETQRGQQLDLQLPDGSRLRLDTATRVEVTYYRHRREVRLPQGQAVFSVQPDALRPFDVLAGPLRVTVVGTRFSVRNTPAMAGTAGVRVAVEHGRVKVERAATEAAGSANAAARDLGPGDQIDADSAGTLQATAPVPAAGIAPWRDNRVSFDNTRLDQALAELERYASTGLVVRDPAVASLRVTGTFNPLRPENFARVLPQAVPVRLRSAGEVSEIVRAE